MIGPNTLHQAKASLAMDLANWWPQIQDAFVRQDHSLTISLSLRLQANGGGKIEIEHGINFVESRVKEKDVVIVDEKQQKLPGME